MPKAKQSKLKWTLKDLRNVFLMEIGMILLLIYGGGLIFNETSPFSNFPESTTTLILFLLQSLALLIPLYVFTVYKYGNNCGEFGVVNVKKKLLIKRVAQGFLMYYIASAMFIQVRTSYDFEIPGFGQQESHVPLFGDSLPDIVLGGLVIVFLAPLVEEIFFRGYIYQVFKKYTSIFWASVLSSMIFAAFHLEFQIFIPIFILGVVLNWIFENSKSLWGPIAFHMINNLLAFALELAIYFEWIDISL